MYAGDAKPARRQPAAVCRTGGTDVAGRSRASAAACRQFGRYFTLGYMPSGGKPYSGGDCHRHYGDGQLVGIIRYCRYQEMGYFLGVELAEGCRWSSQHYRPEHLLDPSQLVDQAMQRHRSDTKQVH